MAVMYRTEVYSGSTKRYFDDVLRFELFELGNVHILHELIQNELVSNSDLIIESLGNELEENGYVDDMSESDQIEFVEKLRQELSAQVG